MGCIYQIRNILNGKIYVGSTWKPLRKRKSEHLTKLRTNKHSSPHLQNSFNKYGEDNFMFEEIESNILPEDLLLKEIHWFTILNPVYNAARDISRTRLYRKNSPEVTVLIHAKRKETIEKRGYTHSPEARERIRKARALQVITPQHKANISKGLEGRIWPKGRKQSKEEIECRTPRILEGKRNKSKRIIEVYDANMNLLFTKRLMADVSRELGINCRSVDQAIRRNKSGMAHGYYFKIKEV